MHRSRRPPAHPSSLTSARRAIKPVLAFPLALLALLAGARPAAAGSSSFTYPTTDVSSVPHAPSVALGATCLDWSGCRTGSDGEELVSSVHAYYARVTVADSSSPTIAPTAGALLGGGWHRGYEEAWAYYADNVGIRRIRLRIDGQVREAEDYNDGGWPDGTRCDY